MELVHSFVPLKRNQFQESFLNNTATTYIYEYIYIIIIIIVIDVMFIVYIFRYVE